MDNLSDNSGNLKNGDTATPERVTVKSVRADFENSALDSQKQSDSQKSVDAQKSVDVQSDKKKKVRKKHNIWWIKAAVISLVLAAFFSFLSDLTASAEHMVIIVLLLAFLIIASILFDAIGVAVTSCDITPIISMASRKVHGAKTAMWLVKNSGTVSSICNDVIGDIFGIISGACSAAIVVKIAASFDGDSIQRWLTIIISAVVSALTIGGKAFMKNVAISNSKEFVMFVARLLAIFNKDERKIRKKVSVQKKSKSDVKFDGANKNNEIR
ncbi:MAG: CNNM domain-containing protein [Clostridia bacterium]|nr:CNNM domain-containing protein [Clostridia bacterium]